MIRLHANDSIATIAIISEKIFKTSPKNIVIVGNTKTGALFAEEKDAFVLATAQHRTDRNVYPAVILETIATFAEAHGIPPQKCFLAPFDGKLYVIAEKSRFSNEEKILGLLGGQKSIRS